MNTDDMEENAGVDSENIAEPVAASAQADVSAASDEETPVQPYSTDDGQNTMWTDPSYESATGDKGDIYTPGRYAYGAQNSHSEPPEPPRRKGRRHGFLRAVCLILVCALAAGAASFGVVDYMLDNRDSSNGGTQATYTLPKKAPTSSFTAEAQKDNMGTYLVLVGTDGTVYALTGFTLYTDSTSENKVVSGDETTVSVSENDKFFVQLSIEQRPAGMPTIATNVASLALAAQNPVYDAKSDTYTITFGENAQIALNSDSSADTDQSYTNTVAFLANLNALGGEGTDGAKSSVVIDLNGGKLTVPGTLSIGEHLFDGVDKLTIKDGSMAFTGLNNNGTYSYGMVITNQVTGEAGKASGEVAFDNVAVTSDGNGISVAYVATTTTETQPVLTMKNSSITAYGEYGISIDAPSATCTAATTACITLDNTDVTMTKPATQQNVVFSTALYVGAPVAVSVKNNSELSASGQVVVVRAGNVDLTNVKLTLVAGITDATVNADNFSALFTQNLGITAPNFTGDGALAGYASGLTFQDYRNAGLWGDGNDVSRGVIVIGNSGTTTYQAPTHLSMAGVTIVNNTTGANAVADFVIASHYAEDSMYTTTGSGDTATKTLKTMVSVTCSDNASLIQNVVITSNSIAKSVSINNVAR